MATANEDFLWVRNAELEKELALKNRALEIEAALERVRSRAMAMRKSAELGELVALLFNELTGLSLVLSRCIIWIIEPQTFAARLWMANTEDRKTADSYFVKPLDHPYFKAIIDGWQRRATPWIYHLVGKEKTAIDQMLLEETELSGLPLAVKEGIRTAKQTVVSGVFHDFGMIEASGPVPFSNEQLTILKRFGDVFNLSYTRFNDLQKAEARIKEAKTEAALERIRASALAMQSSDDLLDVANVLRAEMGELGQPELESSIVHVYNEKAATITAWYAYRSPHDLRADVITGIVNIPKDSSAWASEVIEKYKSAETEYTIVASGKKLAEWYRVLEKIAPITIAYDESGQILIPALLYYHFSKFSGGALLMISNRQPSLEARELQKRAARVFDIAYTRFLDLQQAEAQAREVKIQLALEKVRGKTMAMRNSRDVTTATETMFEELAKLGIDNLRCGIANIHPHSRSFDVFGVTNLEGGNKMRGFGLFGMDEHPIWQRWLKSWNRKEEIFIAYIAGREKEEYFNNINNHHAYLPQQISHFPDSFFQAYYFDQGAVWAYSLVEHNEAEKEIIKQFAKDFSLTFRRYQDLKRAETQAREAQIEAALERVRSKTMAMRGSDDVSVAVATMFAELEQLNIQSFRGGILHIRPDETMEVWSVNTLEDGKIVRAVGDFDMKLHPYWQQLFAGWKNKIAMFSFSMNGKVKEDYIKLLDARRDYLPNGMPRFPDCIVQSYFFSEGAVWTFTEQPHTESEKQIMMRFVSVFSLTFQRYQDLKNAEAQAREAVKASSLDRIRAEIASMRTADDLQRITPLVWKELTILGLPFFRCGVFIMDQKEQKVHIYLSTPNGKALAVLHLDFDHSELTANAARYWRLQEVYRTHWRKEQFTSWAQSLNEQGLIQTVESYQGGDEAPESLTLQLVPFVQGMLYVGSADTLTEAQIDLVKALAEAFSVAYARYEDFKRLEDAKRTVESTLEELRATQAQLIQREKMASLGELTAGIAHEIQNPLNFINNFAEVNTELVEEMQACLEKDRTADAKKLALEIAENDRKITHHGRRADAIVKSMLQHSREASGQKASINVNALVDEYLRLAYHGMRVKDHSFQARIETNFDENMPELIVVPQQIGQVLLNLLNNAFYAVIEKKKKENGSFEPLVSVSTKQAGDRVEITVNDNGTGMSDKVASKVFQPFFTTKPTGEGTGLGLSISYDIITKAHGGKLQVETTEGIGSAFSILLPAKHAIGKEN